MQRTVEPETDLFVAAAESARVEAAKRWRASPHGETRNRLKAFQEATRDALRASVEASK